MIGTPLLWFAAGNVAAGVWGLALGAAFLADGPGPTGASSAVWPGCGSGSKVLRGPVGSPAMGCTGGPIGGPAIGPAGGAEGFPHGAR
ncbi:Transmembrane protein OS=Streptomyces microflavus OX=1919 GN=G3I39_06465 PE=4 SV=1 [Streptomyces microflavus]